MFGRRPPPSERLKPQSDEEYLRAMWPRLPLAQDGLALAIRRMIAEFAGVSHNLVRADATFDDLDAGPADSIDEEDFVLRLEAVLGRELTRSEREQIPSPDSTPRLKVAVFVLALCAVEGG